MPLRWLAVSATVGMLLVLVMGAAVTNTGSSAGCGRSWPLCNGRFVPEFTVSTAIEYSHRTVSGIEGVLVVGLAVWVARRWRQEREVHVLATLMVGSTFLQAGLGAWAVLSPQSPAVIASHFGISLVAFAATFLVATRVLSCPVARQAPPAFRRAVIGMAAYLLGVVYLGAYIRHSGVSLACPDWPLCNGQLVPALDGGTGIVFAHRLAALGAIGLLLGLAVWARRIDFAPGVATAAAGLVILQALSGATVTLTRLGLFSTLLHAGLMAVLFASVAYLGELVLRRPTEHQYEGRRPEATVGHVHPYFTP